MLTKVSTSNEIQVIMNDAKRAILNIAIPKDHHIKDLLKELNILKFKDSVYFESMTWIYKIEKDMMPPSLSRFFKRRKEIHHHQTRQANDFYLSHRMLNRCCNSIYYRSLTEYNKLDFSVKNSECKKVSKSDKEANYGHILRIDNDEQ